MKGKRFTAGERVIVSIDGSQHTGEISRRLDEAGKRWQARLDDGRLHDAAAIDIKRHQVKYVDPTPEEIKSRTAEVQAEWSDAIRLQRQVSKPERVELSESRLWRKTSEGGLSE